MLSAAAFGLAAALSWAPLLAPPQHALARSHAQMRLYDAKGQRIDDECEERREELYKLYGVSSTVAPEESKTGGAEETVGGAGDADKTDGAKAVDAVALETERLTELLASVADITTDDGQERLLGRLRRRLRRGKDAATLLEMAEMLEERDRETLLLQREVSLASTMSDFWSELSASMRGAGSAKAASSPAGAPTPLDKAGERLDEAWRRDALRAILALQRAPEKLEGELRKQRLSKLQPELRILGLHRKRLEALTEADVRAARSRRARDLHPDLRKSREAQRGGGLLGGMFGRASAPADGGEGDAQDEDGRMTELNAAYDRVKRAITAPLIDFGAP